MTTGCDNIVGVTDSDPAGAPHNPAQQQVLDQLAAPPDDRPVFEAELAEELRETLETTLAPIVGHRDRDDALWVSKHMLAQVHGCGAHWLAERNEDFAYSIPVARGAVAHKAIELGVHWRGDTTPRALVEEAFTRLEREERAIAHYLYSLDEAERASLAATATDRVTKFEECFPALQHTWRPVLEGSIRTNLVGGRVVLSGKPDLALGQARGRLAGKVIVDLKTGGPAVAHTDDLRFYALIEVLRIGTPPRRLATYYLDSGTLTAEDVTAPMLESAAMRVIDGISKMVDLLGGEAEPDRVPGGPCNWCPIAKDCEPGQRYLQARNELE
jgi:hypothetical protein